MNIIDLGFELVYKFVPIKQEDWAQMKKDAEEDMKSWTTEHKNPLIRFHQKHCKHWFFRLCVAGSYIPLVRWITSYVEGNNKEENEED